MRKQIRLDSKNSKNKKPDGKNSKTRRLENSRFVLFVRDQGEGAGRVWVIVLKVLELVLTTIFAVMLGIFGPLSVWNAGIVDEEVAADPAVLLWLITSCVYIVGMFTVMLGRAKTAAVIHAIAAVGTLVTYSRFLELFKDVETSSGPTALYMPCLFIALLTLAIMLIINVPKWFERHLSRVNAQAPSILDENTKTAKAPQNKKTPPRGKPKK